MSASEPHDLTPWEEATLRCARVELAAVEKAQGYPCEASQVAIDRVLLLTSYCGGDKGSDCTDERPCNDCLAMCNVAHITGEMIVLGGLDYVADLMDAAR